MQESPAPTPAGAPPRPVGILLLAALQGLGLYALHRAIEAHTWPATDLAVLVPAYLLLIYLPLTAQLQARYFSERRLWGALAALGVVLLALGAYFGARVAPDGRLDDLEGELLFANGFALCILWLLFVPFLRAWLETGRWRAPYRALFDAAWRNKLTLAEALLFTAVFWLLLGLWAALFRTLDIRFFEELFREPLFVYPVTALAFGIALHLVGRIDRIIDAVLGQLLGLLKWLAPLAGLIVVLFTFALLPRLPGLLQHGQRALGATWMLWLVAVTVLLLNAAYQAGDRGAPYGRGLCAAMRAVPPLLLVVALTAAYSLLVRVAQLGLTVGRYWGLVTAAMACVHALAYSVAALRRGPWMGLLGRVNPAIATLLGALLLLSLTPALSPYRLSAASQYRLVTRNESRERREDALRYLRFDTGHYGLARVRAIAAGTDPAAAAADTRRIAKAVLEQGWRWQRQRGQPVDFDEWLARLRVFPRNRTLPEALRSVLRTYTDVARDAGSAALPVSGLWLEMSADPGEEFLVWNGPEYSLYAQRDGRWQRISQGYASGLPLEPNARDRALDAGDYRTVMPDLPDVLIGGARLRLNPMPGPARARPAAPSSSSAAPAGPVARRPEHPH